MRLPPVHCAYRKEYLAEKREMGGRRSLIRRSQIRRGLFSHRRNGWLVQS